MKKIDIARKLGISRPTLDTYFELPNAPKPVGREYNFDEVLAFINSCAKKESTLVSGNPDLKTLKVRELVAKCEKLEFDNQVTKGNYVETAVVKRECTRYALAAKKSLLSIPSKAPLLVGQDPAGIEEKLREWILEPLNMLASGQWVGCECPNCGEEIKV